ncbi:hypothetical protein ALC57_05621 [Trachymyrmex cornetzi]|uniref:DDE Tnp4 domain-containing protein n=1 Tax=Trachymyrmex cornetzi TaxID=471704 RepID=A0A151JAE7_9HYME|nr:hypothetical protein ALC57_05621 [Trachymyrmex cornetzi]
MNSFGNNCLLPYFFPTLYIAWKAKKNKRWRNRRWWVRPINQRRSQYGDFSTLFSELKEDLDLFFRYTRMDVPTFYELLRLVEPYLRKKQYPEQRLAITLRYLATGDQMLSVALAYRIGESNITIQAPPNSGSMYFNYKKTFSLVLIAACDARYRFTLFDVGAYGSDSDGGILSRSFGKASYEGRFLSDQKRIFNYRLSRARRTIENTFGILSARWRIFLRSIYASPDVIDKYVLAAMCLHNFLITKNDEQTPQQQKYCSPEFVDRETERGEIIEGEWRQQSQSDHIRHIGKCGAHRATKDAYTMRDTLSSYFMTPAGQVPWQFEYIHQGLHRDMT